RYGGRTYRNSGVAVGGDDMKVPANAARIPFKDLVIYELMIDDFTAEFADGRAPLDALRDKIPYLADLGVNAIEFMPWTAWPSEDFGWGYNPFQYFSVSSRYTHDESQPA